MENFKKDLFSFLDAKIASKNDTVIIIDFNDYCNEHQIDDVHYLLPLIFIYIDERIDSSLKDVAFIVISQDEVTMMFNLCNWDVV